MKMTPVSSKKKITIEKLECNRCHHSWWPRINNQDKTVIPEVCPKCKSRYWNKERVFPKLERTK